MEKERYEKICYKYGFDEMFEYQDNMYIKVNKDRFPDKKDRKDAICKFIKEDIWSYHSNFFAETEIDRSDNIKSLTNIKEHKMHKVRFRFIKLFYIFV